MAKADLWVQIDDISHPDGVMVEQARTNRRMLLLYDVWYVGKGQADGWRSDTEVFGFKTSVLGDTAVIAPARTEGESGSPVYTYYSVLGLFYNFEPRSINILPINLSEKMEEALGIHEDWWASRQWETPPKKYPICIEPSECPLWIKWLRQILRKKERIDK